MALSLGGGCLLLRKWASSSEISLSNKQSSSAAQQLLASKPCRAPRCIQECVHGTSNWPSTTTPLPICITNRAARWVLQEGSEAGFVSRFPAPSRRTNTIQGPSPISDTLQASLHSIRVRLLADCTHQDIRRTFAVCRLRFGVAAVNMKGMSDPAGACIPLAVQVVFLPRMWSLRWAFSLTVLTL